MINNFRKASDETGRSMIEMLGVLAIVGVLSVGGIAGYSKAMEKFKVSKTQDEIMSMINNIRNVFATEPTYASLTSKFLADGNYVPKDMLTGVDTAGQELKNSYGGAVTVATTASADGVASGHFTVTYGNIPNTACVALASSDWGGDAGGLVSITISGTADSKHDWDGTDATGLPVTIGYANTQCDAGTDNKITWEYR